MMSPEPTQEPIEENLNASNLPVDVRMATDSDSEEEDVGIAGYVPLSQIPADNESLIDEDEDDEWTSGAGEQTHVPIPSVEPQQQCSTETIEVWSTPCNRSNIDLDAEKIDQVKSMMASFTLPTTSIPEWANTISEDQWKKQLIDRIKEMQNRNKQT